MGGDGEASMDNPPPAVFSCAGRPISHLIADFTPNTCEGSGPGALDNYTTSCPFA